MMYATGTMLLKHRSAIDRLNGVSTDELTDILHGLKAQMERRLSPIEMLAESSEGKLFTALGAATVLSRREGRQYVNDVLGYREPATMRERIYNLFTGRPIKKEE